jgi:hypothetical protein
MCSEAPLPQQSPTRVRGWIANVVIAAVYTATWIIVAAAVGSLANAYYYSYARHHYW